MEKEQQIEEKKATKRVLLSVWYILTTGFLLIVIFDVATGEVMFNSLAEFKHSWLLLAFYFSGMAKAIMDTLRFHFSKSVFSKLNPLFWNAEVSSNNKYIDGDYNKGHKKLFWFIPTPDAWLDGWHLAQSIMLTLIVFGAACYTPYITLFHPAINFLIDVFIMRLVFGIGFYGLYNWFLIKENDRKI